MQTFRSEDKLNYPEGVVRKVFVLVSDDWTMIHRKNRGFEKAHGINRYSWSEYPIGIYSSLQMDYRRSTHLQFCCAQAERWAYAGQCSRMGRTVTEKFGGSSVDIEYDKKLANEKLTQSVFSNVTNLCILYHVYSFEMRIVRIGNPERWTKSHWVADLHDRRLEGDSNLEYEWIEL